MAVENRSMLSVSEAAEPLSREWNIWAWMAIYTNHRREPEYLHIESSLTLFGYSHPGELQSNFNRKDLLEATNHRTKISDLRCNVKAAVSSGGKKRKKKKDSFCAYTQMVAKGNQIRLVFVLVKIHFPKSRKSPRFNHTLFTLHFFPFFVSITHALLQDYQLHLLWIRPNQNVESSLFIDSVSAVSHQRPRIQF